LQGIIIATEGEKQGHLAVGNGTYKETYLEHYFLQ